MGVFRGLIVVSICSDDQYWKPICEREGWHDLSILVKEIPKKAVQSHSIISILTQIITVNFNLGKLKRLIGKKETQSENILVDSPITEPVIYPTGKWKQAFLLHYLNEKNRKKERPKLLILGIILF